MNKRNKIPSQKLLFLIFSEKLQLCNNVFSRVVCAVIPDCNTSCCTHIMRRYTQLNVVMLKIGHAKVITILLSQIKTHMLIYFFLHEPITDWIESGIFSLNYQCSWFKFNNWEVNFGEEDEDCWNIRKDEL